MQMTTNNRIALLLLLILLVSIAVGASRCAKIAKADEMPPLYIDHFVPYILREHPTSIGLPPDPID